MTNLDKVVSKVEFENDYDSVITEIEGDTTVSQEAVFCHQHGSYRFNLEIDLKKQGDDSLYISVSQGRLTLDHLRHPSDDTDIGDRCRRMTEDAIKLYTTAPPASVFKATSDYLRTTFIRKK